MKIQAEFYVYDVGALDWFETCTLTVSQWMTLFAGNSESTGVFIGRPDVITSQDELFSIVSRGVLSLSGYGPLRCEPRVCYDYLMDSVMFLFKFDQAGRCLMVTSQPNGHLDPYANSLVNSFQYEFEVKREHVEESPDFTGKPPW